MAKWSLNYLAGSVSEEANFASSYGNWPLKMPPYALGGDKIAIGDSEVRNALAFVLMRDMSGIKFGAGIQKGVMHRILSYQQPCGLFNPPNHSDTDVLWATAWGTRALLEEFATTGNREALSRAGKALKAVRQYAIEVNNRGLMRLAPPEKITLNGQVIRFAYRPSLDFCIVEPFVRYYEVTGNTEMLNIARGLVDGRLEGYGTGHDTGHTHSHWHSLIGIAHFGAVTREKKYLDWVENQFERWTPYMTDYGWFEAIGNYKASETCAVSDLIHVCTYLGRGGRSLRYDLVERTLRNYLPQEQFFVDDEAFMRLWREQKYADREKQMALMRHLEGGFLCRTTPSDRWALPNSPEGGISLEGCCPPTGMTGLYLAWKDVVRKTDKGVFVNMAFNHDSPSAKVVSFLPNVGRVTVIPKHNGLFYVRIPGFVPHDKVSVWRSGRKSDNVVWSGDYVTFVGARKREELTVTYPLATFDQTLKRAGKTYIFHWKGNAVTGIEPSDDVLPLFKKIPYPTPAFPTTTSTRVSGGGKEGIQEVASKRLIAQIRLASQQESTPSAVELATQAIKLAPQQPQSWVKRALAYDIRGEYTKSIADYTQALRLDPKYITAWQARGEAYFKSGKIAESLKDFDKYLLFVPDQKPYHWQRGISLYYAGRFNDGKQQFELHQTVNPHDVENAVWHFLCTARAEGVDSAKKKLIPIEQDARIPMAQVHQLFAGKTTPQEVLDVAQAAPKMTRAGEPLFYAHLYLGLYFEAIGDDKSAKEYILKAAARAKENGYMGDVARVHADILKKRKAKRDTFRNGGHG